MFSLKPPRHIPTLPFAPFFRQAGHFRSGISSILTGETLDDATRAHAALALARVADAEDLHDLRSLIDTDIKQRNSGSVVTSFANRYVQALLRLEAPGADRVLIELLREPKYESHAASGLLQLLLPPDQQKTWPGNNRPDYEAIWSARAGRPPGFDVARAAGYAQAVAERISALMDERSKSANPDHYVPRLKDLAFTLAKLDGRHHVDLVVEVLALPGRWDQFVRMNGIKALLLSGATLSLNAMRLVLDPAIEYLLSQGARDQELTLLTDCLALLPFSSDPEGAIAHIEQVAGRLQFRPYQFRDLVAALGHSRSEAAVGFLLRFARGGLQNMEDTWIEALARLDVPAARRALLSFIDPEIHSIGITINFDFRNRELFASYIAEWARHDPALRRRLFALSEHPPTPTQRELLPAIYAELASPEAMLAAVNLLQVSLVPYGLGRRGLESLFLERHPYDLSSGTFNLVPRNADHVRAKLFQMVLQDPQRRQVAFSILGQIEVWRLEYGRPNGEPRHPMIESCEPWPPISFIKSIEGGSG
jgi:hypothetical protein